MSPTPPSWLTAISSISSLSFRRMKLTPIIRPSVKYSGASGLLASLQRDKKWKQKKQKRQNFCLSCSFCFFCFDGFRYLSSGGCGQIRIEDVGQAGAAFILVIQNADDAVHGIDLFSFAL